MENAQDAKDTAKTLQQLLSKIPGFREVKLAIDDSEDKYAVQIFISSEDAARHISALLNGKFQGVKVYYQYTGYGKPQPEIAADQKPSRPPSDFIAELPTSWVEELEKGEAVVVQNRAELIRLLEKFSLELALKLRGFE